MSINELLASPYAHTAVVVLIVMLVAAIILKAAKGCIKFLILVILIAVLIIYVLPMFI